MAYNKPIKRIMLKTINNVQYLGDDTADGDRSATYAIDAIKAKKTIKLKDGNADVLIPFHAVKLAQYVTFSAEAEKADPYCE